MGFPLGVSSNGAPWWVGSIVNKTQTINIWIFQHKNPKQLVQIKKLKRNLRETDSEDEVESPFPRFISIESKSSPITSLSPFIIEKVISSNITPKSVKKMIHYSRRWKKENMRTFS